MMMRIVPLREIGVNKITGGRSMLLWKGCI